MLYPNIIDRKISRRDFLYAGSMAAASLFLGCATNPVTGESQLMLMSEGEEISIDKQHSLHQFSTDYGAVQDPTLQDYMSGVGKDLGSHTHRRQMPYSFRAVNATYINAYAFPGGSIASTRGILLELDSEAQLAALMGHELGHVNARHTASLMSKRMVAMALAAGVGAYVGIRQENMGAGIIATQLGMLTSGAFLAAYSRDNERQADALGMEYMVKAGYNPEGMTGLMEMLKNMNKKKPSAAQLLFATHPMSDERYDTAKKSSETLYAGYRNHPIYRERYMDHTAGIRKIEGPIRDMQKGEELMGKKKYADAETTFKKALSGAPDDYAGLVMTSKSLIAQNKYDEAERYIDKATTVNPTEAQAHHLSGYSKLHRKDFSGAYQEFDTYHRNLPGNPNTDFFKGLALEGMGKREPAAQEFHQYLRQVSEGQNARYAYGRLKQWGYLR